LEGDIVMAGKPSYEELERSIKQLEREVLEYLRKEKEYNEERKLLEYSHIRRTISLMKINEKLEKEIKERTCADAQKLEQLSLKLRGRIKELKCLYDISSFSDATDFSLDAILQAVIDFIPPAFQYPELTCARINFDHYEFTTKNFKDTKWKLVQKIIVNNKKIGTLEICYLEKKPVLYEGPFFKEAKNLIGAIAETIANIVEREWAELEIRKHRNHVEKLLENSSTKIAVHTND